MKLVIVTPDGIIFNDDIDYIVISSKATGDFAILENHAPIIATIDAGTIKILKDQKPVFSVIIHGVLEHQDNNINIIAQEANIGLNKEDAMNHLSEVRHERLLENRRRTMDFLNAEQQLKKSIREAQAANR